MIFKKGTRLLSARVTHLEMCAPSDIKIVVPEGEELCVRRVQQCPLHFYRYLYERVGRAHHWTQRLKKTDAALQTILHDPKTILHLFYVDGCPVGFAETTLRAWPVAEILYFGLIADFQGHGWSGCFFSKVLKTLWERNPEKLIIQTNTLDSPLALKLYQKMGFRIVLTRDVVIEAWPED